MIKALINIFIPHQHNNHRSKILQPQPIAFLLAIFLTFQVGIKALAQVKGGVLGYASNITIEQIFEQTNQARATQNIPPLSYSSTLSQAAQAKAADMFTFDYWAHINPENGHEPWYFIDQSGYGYTLAGENLARDFATTPPAIQAWLDSPTHRDNLFSDKYTETGIAVVDGKLDGFETTLIVQMFGTPKLDQARSKIPGVLAAQPESFESTVPTPAPKSNINLVSPLSISKAASLVILGFLALALIIDVLYIIIKKPSRNVGKNWLHLLFIGTLILIIYRLVQGSIL